MRWFLCLNYIGNGRSLKLCIMLVLNPKLQLHRSRNKKMFLIQEEDNTRRKPVWQILCTYELLRTWEVLRIHTLLITICQTVIVIQINTSKWARRGARIKKTKERSFFLFLFDYFLYFFVTQKSVHTSLEIEYNCQSKGILLKCLKTWTLPSLNQDKFTCSYINSE
jgi:quinol-cytochrome oxidoreductase complex cytochrome b subunit